MRSWRDDQRFKCPGCGRVIYLTVVDPDDHPKGTCRLVAICIECRHIFTSDEWRKLHVTHDPPDNADSRPGAR